MNATGVLEEVRAHAPPPNDHESLTRAAERVAPGCGGVTFVPYLVGERVPDRPHATGALLGLRPGCLDSAVIYRAAIEGVSANLAWGVDRMRRLGIQVDSVRLVGGGARNPLWRQVLADVLAAPVQELAEPESAALGAALQGAWARARSAGEPQAIDALAQAFVRPAGTGSEPSDAVRAYREIVARFRELAGRA